MTKLHTTFPQYRTSLSESHPVGCCLPCRNL
uniref:Uncharacterized protein n=1 Tax=Arundo donax TaxID=35708 RepID=A0A0A9G8M7_ARUDO